MTEPTNDFSDVGELTKDLVACVLQAAQAHAIKPGALIAIMAMTSVEILRYVGDNSKGYSYEQAATAFRAYLDGTERFFAENGSPLSPLTEGN